MPQDHETLEDVERDAGQPLPLSWVRNKLPGAILGASLMRCLDSIGDDWTADGADTVRG